MTEKGEYMNGYYDGHKINFSSSNGYPTIYVNGKNILLHRYVWEKYYGSIPVGFQVHHKDGCKMNYDVSNLELLNVHDHQRYHALNHKLGTSNKGVHKRHQSGFAPINHPVVITKDGVSLCFQSMTEAKDYLGLKGTNSIANVLSGRSKTAKGWMVRDAK